MSAVAPVDQQPPRLGSGTASPERRPSPPASRPGLKNKLNIKAVGQNAAYADIMQRLLADVKADFKSQLKSEIMELRRDLTKQILEVRSELTNSASPLFKRPGSDSGKNAENSPGMPLGTPRAAAPTTVDTTEDLGQLLSENADLERLVNRVREAQRNKSSIDARQQRRMSIQTEEMKGPLARKGLRHATFHPHARSKLLWDALQLLALCFSLITLPLILAFEEAMPPAHATALRAVNAFIDAIVILDIGVGLRTAFFVEGAPTPLSIWPVSSSLATSLQLAPSMVALAGVLVRDVNAIAWHYIQSSLLRDLLGALPISLARAAAVSAVPGWVPLPFALVRLQRFRRLAASAMELLQICFSSSNASGNPGQMRLGRLGSLFLLTCHWVGCCWFAIALHGGDAAAATGGDSLDSPNEWGPPPWLLKRPWAQQCIQIWGSSRRLVH